MKQKFDVTGMTCSACSAHVEKAVSKVEGVRAVTVNLLSNNMAVEYDEAAVDAPQIIHAVEDAGYGASVHSAQPVRQAQKPVDHVQEEISNMKFRLVV